MIISRTPLRISFLGGGTDFPDFYNESTGAVITSAIDKYIYVVAKQRFDDNIVLHYTKTETTRTLDEIQHELIREALRMAGVEKGIEITTLADIPSEGTGLGSSSSLAVGLLHALYRYTDQKISPERLAEDACKLEIDILGRGIGKQDQYIAALGGLKGLAFQKDKITSTHPFKRSVRRELANRCMLFYTGITRQASVLLRQQKDNIPTRKDVLTNLLKIALLGFKNLDEEKYHAFGKLIEENWQQKKLLAASVSNEMIDYLHDKAMDAGATGAKICGAGGGGFMLVFCEDGKHDNIRKALVDYQELPFRFEEKGSQLILE